MGIIGVPHTMPTRTWKYLASFLFYFLFFCLFHIWILLLGRLASFAWLSI